MVVPNLINEWAARLEILRREADAQPPDRAWYLRIHIRILSFLLARYSADATGELDDGDAEPPVASFRAELEPPAPLRFRHPGAAVETPPKTREELAAALTDIEHANNRQRRINLVGDDRAGDAWQWWRDEWCARRRP